MRKLLLFVAACWMLGFQAKAAESAVLLEWERSYDLRTWEKVPPNELIYTLGGGVVVTKGEPNAFYRLLIREPKEIEPGDRLTLERVPLEFHRRAAQLIEEMRDNEMAPDWQRAKLGDIVQPLYRPDVKEVAYYEFRVNSVLPGAKQDDPRGEKPAGFIILSTGDHDYPIPHWNDRGESPSQELERLAAQEGQRPARFFKLDALSYAAENDQGELIATLGTPPIRITGLDPRWLELKEFELSEAISTPVQAFEADDEVKELNHRLERRGPDRSPIEFEDWPSWREMKAGYEESYAVLIESLRREAQEDWETEEFAREFGEGLVRGEIYNLALLHRDPRIEINGDIANFAEVVLDEREGLLPAVQITVFDAPRQEAIPFEVIVVYPNDSKEAFRFALVPQQNRTATHTTGHWSPWTHYWAGTHGDQRLYNQFTVSGCASGCGATAWAMLFGWADRQAAIGNTYWAPRWGLYRVNGGYGADAVAPVNMDTGIRNITLEIRGHIDTFCLFGSGATFPWDMPDAWKYFINRTGTYLRCNWNSLGISTSGLRERARDSIRDRQTPAVIGTGWLNHYPLAYGYAWRKRTVKACLICVWTTTEYSRWFYVNQGWGGSQNGWVSASTWFAGRICPTGSCP